MRSVKWVGQDNRTRTTGESPRTWHPCGATRFGSRCRSFARTLRAVGRLQPPFPLVMQSFVVSSFVSLRGAQLAAVRAELPVWVGRSPKGEVVRVAVPAPENKRFEHLAWPKAVR